MTIVEIYSKENCSLCDRAKEKLRELRTQHPFELHEVLLKEGDARFEEFSRRVPVTIVAGRVQFDYTVPEKEFVNALTAAASDNA